jgi:hypothetical protein
MNYCLFKAIASVVHRDVPQTKAGGVVSVTLVGGGRFVGWRGSDNYELFVRLREGDVISFTFDKVTVGTYTVASTGVDVEYQEYQGVKLLADLLIPGTPGVIKPKALEGRDSLPVTPPAPRPTMFDQSSKKKLKRGRQATKFGYIPWKFISREEELVLAEEFLRGGVKQVSLAAKYQVSPTRVRRIVRRYCLEANMDLYMSLRKYPHGHPRAGKFRYTLMGVSLKSLKLNADKFLKGGGN